MNTLLLTLFLVTTQQPAHTPTAKVEGDVVSIDADFASIANSSTVSPVIEVVSGVQLLSDKNILAGSRNSGPISWRLRPGQYNVTAHGYPNDYRSPFRTQVILTVSVAQPDRLTRIKSALNRVAASIAELDTARDELKTLAPTAVEIQTALDTKP